MLDNCSSIPKDAAGNVPSPRKQQKEYRWSRVSKKSFQRRNA